MKKRLMSLLLTAAMIVSMVVVPAAAADPVTVSVGSASGMPGETVTVDLNLENLTDEEYIGAFQIEIAFDSDDLEAIQIIEGRKSYYVTQNETFWEKGSFQSTLKNGNIVSLGAVNSDGWPGSGTIGTIQFKIKDDVTVEKTDLTVSIKKITLLELDNSQTDITTDVATTAGEIDIIYPATATTETAEQTSVTTAILNGSYTTIEGVTAEAAGIKWGTSQDALTNTAEFGAEVEGAQGDTIYFQAYATVAGVDYVGEIESIVLAGPTATKVEVTSDKGSIEVPTETAQFTATVYDQFGNAIEGAAVTWSEDGEEVEISADGVLSTNTKTLSQDTVTVTATYGELSGTATIGIVRPEAVVKEIAISADATVAVPTVADGGEASVELSASGTDQFGETVTLDKVEWSISDAEGVSVDGNVITVTNEAEAGTVTVTAKYGTVTAAADLTITKAPSSAEAVTVSGPEAGEIAADADTVLNYAAAVVDQFGAEFADTITWTVTGSDNASISADGVLTVKAGSRACTLTVTATASSGKSDDITVTLNRAGAKVETVTISGGTEVILPALNADPASVEFTAAVVDNFGDPVNPDVTWNVTKAEGVSIDENGKLTVTNAASVGTVDVTATMDGVTSSAITVTIAKAASVATAIAFDSDAVTMTIPTDDTAKTDTFTAVVTDQYGEAMDAAVTYALKGDEYVSAEGNTVSVKKGATADSTYTLKATYGDLSAELTITVVDIEMNWVYTVNDAVYGAKWSEIVKVDTKKSSATLEGKDIPGTFSVENASEVPNAGDQPFTVRFVSTDGNYDVTTTDIAVIAQKAIAAKWDGYKGLTYGDEVNVTATAEVELTVSNGDKTDAGTYTATAAVAGENAKNYVLTDATASQEYTVAQAKGTISVADQIIRASKTSEQLATQIGKVEADGVNGETIKGTLTVTDDISGKTASAKAQKVNVSFAHENPNYVSPIAGTVMVTFTVGDPQTITVADVNATYGDAPVANAAKLDAGTGAISYVSEDETVATVDANGVVTITGAGLTSVTVTAAADGDWAETSVTYTVLVEQKEVTLTNISSVEKVYDGGNSIAFTGTATLVGVVEGDDVAPDITNAYAAFESVLVGEYDNVAIDNLLLTGEDADNYYINAQSTTGKITKADATITLGDLKQKPGKVEAVTATVEPYSEGVTVVVEYYIAPVTEVACDHTGDKLCTTDGSACQHTDCGCSYAPAVDGFWTDDISLIQEKGEYPVRAYTEGDANINPITVENAVTGTLVVKKSSSSGGSSSSGSSTEEPIVDPTPVVPEEISFADVTEDDWFHDYVIEAAEQELFTGVDEDHFAPNVNMNRAMMVTVLAALEFGSEGAPKGESDFTDLTANWYKNAVAWAAENKITAGITDTEFGPDLALTREQVAVFLYAYAQMKGYDVSVGEDTNILSYNDIADLSEWAIPAMQWACGEGLIEGTPNGDLLPKAVATRAQVAVILVNFDKLIND